MPVMPIVSCALGTVTKGLERGLEDLEIRERTGIIQTTALSRSVRILWRILKTCRDLLSLKLLWETISVSGCEKLAMSKIIIIIIKGTTRGVMVIVVGNGHEFKSWTRLIAFHIALIPLGKVWILLFSLQLWLNSRAD